MEPEIRKPSKLAPLVGVLNGRLTRNRSIFRETVLLIDNMYVEPAQLDIVIDPDLSWRWKDEDEIAEAVSIGLVAQDWADAVRREGERVIERLEARQSPFCDGWESWQPDPDWPLPELPEGWDDLPGATRAQRRSGEPRWPELSR